jgi:uridine kinase
VLCGHDPLTGQDHRGTTVSAPPDAILIVDSVFAFRPQYNDCWEYRIWLDVDPDVALRRGVSRDTALEGLQALHIEEAIRLHRDRYGVAEQIYLAEVNPRALADVVIDNTDLSRPRILTAPG